MGKRGKEIAPGKLPPALLESAFPDARNLRKFRFLVGGVNHSWGSTELVSASSAEEGNAMTLHQLPCRWLSSPPLQFLHGGLGHFQLHMLHLHPNAVSVLAIFSQLCEGFVGVRPSLELFRHFFSARRSLGNQTSGCVTFCLAGREAEADFIPLNLHEPLNEWR